MVMDSRLNMNGEIHFKCDHHSEREKADRLMKESVVLPSLMAGKKVAANAPVGMVGEEPPREEDMGFVVEEPPGGESGADENKGCCAILRHGWAKIRRTFAKRKEKQRQAKLEKRQREAKLEKK